jgi:hypothetical protein
MTDGNYDTTAPVDQTCRVDVGPCCTHQLPIVRGPCPVPVNIHNLLQQPVRPLPTPLHTQPVPNSLVLYTPAAAYATVNHFGQACDVHGYQTCTHIQLLPKPTPHEPLLTLTCCKSLT